MKPPRAPEPTDRELQKQIIDWNKTFASHERARLRNQRAYAKQKEKKEWLERQETKNERPTR